MLKGLPGAGGRGTETENAGSDEEGVGRVGDKRIDGADCRASRCQDSGKPGNDDRGEDRSAETMSIG